MMYMSNLREQTVWNTRWLDTLPYLGGDVSIVGFRVGERW